MRWHYPIRFLGKYCIKMDPNTLLTHTHIHDYFYISHPALFFLCWFLSYQLNSISNPCLDSLSPLSHSQYFFLFFSCYTTCCLSRSHPPSYFFPFLFFFLQPGPHLLRNSVSQEKNHLLGLPSFIIPTKGTCFLNYPAAFNHSPFSNTPHAFKFLCFPPSLSFMGVSSQCDAT